jgi:DNA-binding transcriptional ArsR family regulator
VFEVLAEPNRRRILDLLRDGRRPVGELVQSLQISQPAVSKHLRILREAGFVQAEVDAQRRMYGICAQPLRELDDWLAPYRRMWADSLEALQSRLDELDEPATKTPASEGGN